jgi:F0F1-type ATP synthase assembly protein I
LAVPIAEGALLGYWLDRRYHTGPVVTMVTLIVAAIAGYANVIRLIRRLNGDSRRAAPRYPEQDGAP